MNTPDTTIAYAVEYQTEESKGDDWFLMTGRDHNESYRHIHLAGHFETTSMDEAVEIAEALVNRVSYPQDPRSRYYRRVTRSRVITRVYVGHISAVYEAR